MPGTDTVRHCHRCDRHVYNVSGMTATQAEHFLRRQQGRVCVRLLRRRDGRLLTRDGMVGRRGFLRCVYYVLAAVLAMAGLPSCVVQSMGAIDVERKPNGAQPPDPDNSEEGQKSPRTPSHGR
ncbi:MAG TPA: hypothetical protein VFI31_28045 [Pirellulales bacterium]|nr:hypothetical protein [Pirellulales bacterium]